MYYGMQKTIKPLCQFTKLRLIVVTCTIIIKIEIIILIYMQPWVTQICTSHALETVCIV